MKSSNHFFYSDGAKIRPLMHVAICLVCQTALMLAADLILMFGGCTVDCIVGNR